MKIWVHAEERDPVEIYKVSVIQIRISSIHILAGAAKPCSTEGQVRNQFSAKHTWPLAIYQALLFGDKKYLYVHFYSHDCAILKFKMASSDEKLNPLIDKVTCC